MREKLFEIFSNRPDRFHLLEKGLRLIEMKRRISNRSKIVEIGCGYGDASAYLAERYGCRVTGIDIREQKIELAKKRHHQAIKNNALSFLVADAAKLPVKNGTYEYIFAEAVFSSLTNKEGAAKEWYRVLSAEGYLLINDFAIKNRDDNDRRDDVAYIPCFAGVDTIEHYEKYLMTAGFIPVIIQEEYGELIRLALWLSKSLQVDILQAGRYLSTYYSANNNHFVCESADKNDDFFQQTQLTYCQLLFQKKYKFKRKRYFV